METGWEKADIKPLENFDAEKYLEWLRHGLLLWDDPQTLWQAFAPIQDRFMVHEDPEPQIVEMFQVMPPNMQKGFLDAIAIGFAETEPGDDGYDFIDSILRISKLLGREEPLEAMVVRLSESPFLDSATEDVAEHLYASQFFVFESLPELKNVDLIRRAMVSRWWESEYEPRVREILTRFGQLHQ